MRRLGWGVFWVCLLWGVMTAVLPMRAAPIFAPSGRVFYVAPEGSDENEGSQQRPFRTLQHAVMQLQPGDTLYIREGTYPEQLTLTTSGTPEQVIFIAAYPGEQPRLDGQNRLPEGKGEFAPLLKITASYVTISGLEVANSTGRGVLIEQASHVTLLGLNIHHNWKDGLQVSKADHIVVEDSLVWQNIQARPQAGIIGGSGFAFVETRDSVARGNQVYNNFGEGLVAGRRTESIVLEENVVWDNRHANLYLLNTRHTVARRNLVYCTDDRTFWRTGTGEALRAGNGLILQDEVFEIDPDVPVSNGRIVVNNIVVGCGLNFAIFTQHPQAGVRNALIAYNTFVEARGDDPETVRAVHIAPGQHENALFVNNLILQSTGQVATGLGAADNAIQFSHNLYSRDVPAAFRSPDDVIEDPLLQRPFIPNTRTRLDPAWYSLQTNSPARDRAKPLSDVVTDFGGRSRSERPDIGAWELPEGDTRPQPAGYGGETAVSPTRPPASPVFWGPIFLIFPILLLLLLLLRLSRR